MLLTAGLLGFTPADTQVPTSPAAPRSDATHPLVMQQAAQEVAGAKIGPTQPFRGGLASGSEGPGGLSRLQTAAPGSPQREVFGFALASSLSDPTLGYPTWDFSILSTVAFFGLHVQSGGNFANDSGWTVWNSSQLGGLLSAAHAHGTRVVLTIILQDFSPGTPTMCAGLSHGAATVSQTVSEMKAKGVDGVNVDYEGLNGSCGTTDPSWARHRFTSFIAGLRSAMPAGSYLSVDTYAGSAADSAGFYDIPGLAPYTDSYFVMAYDLEYSNYSRAPTNCSSFCLGPTAPLAGYHYTDTSTVQQYTSVVAASKVLLGVPYYGRKSCVAAANPNQVPTSSVAADMYLDATGESTASGVQAGSYAAHRDANDPQGNERWDTWVNTTLNCTRELYWDDTTSLAHKYDLVNNSNLRGVGIWNLNYGGGAPELWQLLAQKFGTSTPWQSLGGILTTAPDASSWGASRVDAFVRGTDNGLWQAGWNGSAWSWTALNGTLTSAPAAVSWGVNRIDVFARGGDNGLWHRWWDGVRWSGWQSLGGGLTSGPDVASRGTGSLDVFARGNDNGLWHMWFDSAGWHGWQPLGGILTSDPTTVSWGSNRVDVFARGTDNALWHLWWDSAGWHPWERLGGILGSGPDVSSCAAGHLDVFAVGSDHALWRLGFNGSAWGSWQRLGGLWTSDPGAVCAPGTTSVYLFDQAPGRALWQTTVTGS